MKERYKKIARQLIRLSPLYLKAARESKEMRVGKLSGNNKRQEILLYAINNVPYYRNHYSALLKQKDFSFEMLPFLEKTDVIGREEEFISEKAFRYFLMKKSTGGTTGLSLNLQKNLASIISETFFIDQIFSLISPVNTQRIATLRALKPKNNIYEYEKPNLVLSSYDINTETTRLYLELIAKYKIDCLHAFPSSLSVLCKYINELGTSIKVPKLKGIVTSSETISRNDKELVLKTFPGVKLIDIYGQNEHTALAFSVNLDYYQFVNEYSFVEFVDSGNQIAENKIYEIIGTNYTNKAMPLIRYKTEDFVEVDQHGHVLSILGRTQDIIINDRNELVPCILSMRPNTLKNVINYQYFQEKAGELHFRAVVNKSFKIEDQKAIEQDISSSFRKKIKPIIVKMDSIERLPNGKQKRLVQMLDLSKYQ